MVNAHQHDVPVLDARGSSPARGPSRQEPGPTRAHHLVEVCFLELPTQRALCLASTRHRVTPPSFCFEYVAADAGRMFRRLGKRSEARKMARQLIERVVSDLSGQPIPEGQAWTMTLTPPDRRRNPVRLDISEAEARQFASKGTEIKRRGRRPGSKNKTSTTKTSTRKTSARGRSKSKARGRGTSGG